MLVKYPKTMHLPWSPGLQNDDRVIQSLVEFYGKPIVITEKMDGENATMYHDHYHARSLDSRHHPSRDWMKAFHGSIKHDIPKNLRVCGENLYAFHSIFYDELPSYFMGFSIWEGDWCLSWNETLLWFEMIGITPVHTIYEGIWDEEFIRGIKLTTHQEGYVVRLAAGFYLKEFQSCVAKYVRKDHIQTDEHWMSRPVIPNRLRAE